MRAARSAAFLAGAAVLFWSFGFARLVGSDLFWNLANGRWILRSGRIPLTDPFSFSRAGAPWLQHEWLSGVLFALWERAFGLETLVFWKWLLVAATFTLLFDALRRASGSAVAALAASVLAAATAEPFLDIRPHVWGLLGIALVLHRVGAPQKPPLWLPLLFAVWVNLHASFLFGLLALTILLAPSILSADPTIRRRVLLVVGGSWLASLANPNLARVFAYPLAYAFDRGSPWREMAEWRSPFIRGGIGGPVFVWSVAALLAATVGLLARRGGASRTTPLLGALALSQITLAMAVVSRRFIPIFGIAAAVVIAHALASVPAIAAVDRSRLGLVAPLAALVWGVLRLQGEPLLPSRAFPALVDARFFPAAACDALERLGDKADVFNYYNWGGYLEWRLGGRVRVFIDGRADAVYDEATYRRYLTFLSYPERSAPIVSDSGAGFFLWPAERSPAAIATSGEWRLAHADETAVLFARVRAVPAGTAP